MLAMVSAVCSIQLNVHFYFSPCKCCCVFFSPVAKSISQASICSQLPVGHVFTVIVLAGLLSDIQIPLDWLLIAGPLPLI